jgi:ATP-dependent DNA helicase RecQ
MKAEAAPPEALMDMLPRGRTRDPQIKPRIASASSDVPLDPDAEARFQRLRAARGQLARDRQLPAYVICHDSTLKLIAARAPSSLAQLEQIKGIGPMKVKLYGEALLAAVDEA